MDSLLLSFFNDFIFKKTKTKIAKSGVQADYMIPSFPTKTFTNHYTIVTVSTYDFIFISVSEKPNF